MLASIPDFASLRNGDAVMGVPALPVSPRLLTVNEAAVNLGVSSSWVRRHVRELPAVRLGRLVKLDSSLLLRLPRAD